MSASPLGLGEPLALAVAPSNRNPRFVLGSLGGRYVLLCVVADPSAADAALGLARAVPRESADRLAAIWWTGAPDDARANTHDMLVFHDADGALARELRLLDPSSAPEGRWLLFDPSLRLLAHWRLADGAAALQAFEALPPTSAHAGTPLHAPVLIAPRIFEPAFCEALIAYYEAHGGRASGVMRNDAAGKTISALDDNFKRRADCVLEDERLRRGAMQRIVARLAPEIAKAFMWRPTRMERYIVACYDAQSGGFFRPHRDNTTKGTAHRRFAVTLNLNTGDYEGGDLRFPEFGQRTYCAPRGGAVVFACALLHEATPVTRGKRYAFLPFLYDEDAAAIRAQNNPHLDENVPRYNALD